MGEWWKYCRIEGVAIANHGDLVSFWNKTGVLATAAQFLVNLLVMLRAHSAWQGIQTTSVATTSQMIPGVSPTCYCSPGMRRVALQPLSLDTTHSWLCRSKNASRTLPVSLTCGVERDVCAKWRVANFCKITSKRGCYFRRRRRRGRRIPPLFWGHSRSIPQGMIFDVQPLVKSLFCSIRPPPNGFFDSEASIP